MPTTLHENRPSAGIGVVEVQKLEFFCDFCGARATLCGDRRGRGAKTRGFLRFLRCSRDPLRGSAWSRCKNSTRATLCADRRGRGAKTRGFLRFLRCPRNALRESAWSRCKNSRFFLRFLRCPRNALRESAWSRCKNSRFLRLLLFELVLESCLVVRAPAPGPAGRGFDSSLVRGRASQDATCILKQLAQSNLHRATCADQLAPTSLRRAPCLEQLAQSNLRRATCTEQLAQSSLHRATCRERNLHRATCREPLAGTNLPEQLARSNLRRATCTDQLAPTSLRRAPCLVLSRACFTNASWREKERILQRWADLACDVMLPGQPWSSLCLLAKRAL